MLWLRDSMCCVLRTFGSIFCAMVGSNVTAVRVLSTSGTVVSGLIKVFGMVTGTIANGLPETSFAPDAAPYPAKEGVEVSLDDGTAKEGEDPPEPVSGLVGAMEPEETRRERAELLDGVVVVVVVPPCAPFTRSASALISILLIGIQLPLMFSVKLLPELSKCLRSCRSYPKAPDLSCPVSTLRGSDQGGYPYLSPA